MNLLLLHPEEVAHDGHARLSGDRARHLLQVLKTAPGREVRIGLLDGPLGVGTVIAVEPPTVELRCEFSGAPPPRPAVDLLLALPRPKVLGRLWAQLAALGIGRIMLSNAERVERAYFDTHVLDPDHYVPRLIEGLQQARDTRLPTVSIHRRFRVLVEDEIGPANGDCRIVADPAAGSSVRTVVTEQRASRVLLAIGPEGGWNPFERALLASHGFAEVAMGPRTLRTDTACIALIALVHEELRASP